MKLKGRYTSSTPFIQINSFTVLGTVHYYMKGGGGMGDPMGGLEIFESLKRGVLK